MTKANWAWMHDGSESAEGPFPTRAKAVADHARHEAEEACGLEKKCGNVRYGTCDYPDPVRCLPGAERLTEDILEQMDEAATDDVLFSDEALFIADKAATAALSKALTEWARKHVRALQWTFREDAR